MNGSPMWCQLAVSAIATEYLRKVCGWESPPATWNTVVMVLAANDVSYQGLFLAAERGCSHLVLVSVALEYNRERSTWVASSVQQLDLLSALDEPYQALFVEAAPVELWRSDDSPAVADETSA